MKEPGNSEAREALLAIIDAQPILLSILGPAQMLRDSDSSTIVSNFWFPSTPSDSDTSHKGALSGCKSLCKRWDCKTLDPEDLTTANSWS